MLPSLLLSFPSAKQGMLGSVPPDPRTRARHLSAEQAASAAEEFIREESLKDR